MNRLLRATGAPYPRYLGRVIRDGIVTWVLVRAMFAIAFAIAGFGAVARHPPPTVRVALIALTALLIWIDRRQSQELLLPANLGVRGIWFWCATIVSAALMDAATHAVLAAR